jgi:hypothetical protein
LPSLNTCAAETKSCWKCAGNGWRNESAIGEITMRASAFMFFGCSYYTDVSMGIRCQTFSWVGRNKNKLRMS